MLSCSLLGALNEFIPKRFRSPDTPSKELVKTPDLDSVKEDIKVKEDSHVAEDRADLNLLEPENDKEQNGILSGKKREQENDDTMPQ
jgi:hypothetical protein